MRKPKLNLPTGEAFLRQRDSFGSEGRYEFFSYGRVLKDSWANLLRLKVNKHLLKHGSKKTLPYTFDPQMLAATTKALAHGDALWHDFLRTSGFEDEAGTIRHLTTWINKCLMGAAFPFVNIDIESGEAASIIFGLDISAAHNRLTAGYNVASPAYQGKGAATAAGKMFLRWAFDAGITYVSADISMRNDGSIGWAKKLGFRLRGVRPNYMWRRDNDVVDMGLFGITREEWDALNSLM